MNPPRNGGYPPPPFWPDRLTRFDRPVEPVFEIVMALFETAAEVRHTYLADGHPGPCWTEWSGASEYIDWYPALTIERAERGAAR